MCKLCDNEYCARGERCRLGPFVAIPAVDLAIKRVQKIDSEFVAYGFGELWYDGGRPAPVTAVWEYIAQRAVQCPYCKRMSISQWQIDHKIPWNAYLHQMLGIVAYESLSMPMFIARILGSDPDNLEPLCRHCNASKGDRMPGTLEFDRWKADCVVWGQGVLAGTITDVSDMRQLTQAQREARQMLRTERQAEIEKEKQEQQRRLRGSVTRVELWT